MTQAFQSWTNEAIKADPNLPNIKHSDDRNQAPRMGKNHTKAFMGAWVTDNAIDRITASDDPKAEYIEVMLESLGLIPRKDGNRGTFLEFLQKSDNDWDVPEWFGCAEHVAGELHACSHRIVKGSINELIAAEYLNNEGFNVLHKNEAIQAHPTATNATELENAECDLMTQEGTEKVTVWQVKSSKTAAKSVTKADKVIIVNEGKVRRVMKV